MEFCSVVLRQLDANTAEIRTILNTDVLLVLFRKKQSTTEFYETLREHIRRQLIIEFDIDFDDELSESMGEIQQRTHRGYTNQGHAFVSVLSIVKVNSSGGGLTRDLSNAIVDIIEDAMVEQAPLSCETKMTIDSEKTTITLSFDGEKMRETDIEEIVKLAKNSVEKEIRKEFYKLRV